MTGQEMDEKAAIGRRTAVVTGADRGLGSALCAGLLERGWRVAAGQYLPEWPELKIDTALANAELDPYPIADRSVHCVVCFEVLEHLDQPDLALGRIAAASSDYVVVSVPWEPYFRKFSLP